MLELSSRSSGASVPRRLSGAAVGLHIEPGTLLAVALCCVAKKAPPHIKPDTLSDRGRIPSLALYLASFLDARACRLTCTGSILLAARSVAKQRISEAGKAPGPVQTRRKTFFRYRKFTNQNINSSPTMLTSMSPVPFSTCSLRYI